MPSKGGAAAAAGKAGGKGKKGAAGAAAAIPEAAKRAVVYAQSQSEIKDDYAALVACLVSDCGPRCVEVHGSVWICGSAYTVQPPHVNSRSAC